MAKHLPAAGSFAAHYILALLLFGSLLSLTWLANAQDPADKGDGKKGAAGKKDKDGLFDDAEIDESKAKPNRNGPPPVVDLKQAAKDPKLNPAVRELFAKLAAPHDVVNYRRDKPFRQAGYSDIKPLDKYWGDKLPADKTSKFEEFQPGDAQPKTIDVPTVGMVSIIPYEKLAVDLVKEFRAKPLDTASPPLSRYGQDVAAEQVLSRILVWHESARGTGERQGKDWDSVIASVRKELLVVLLDELKELTDAKDWEGAFALAKRVTDNYPNAPEVAVPFARLIKESLASPLDPDLRRRTREQLEQLVEKYPGKKEVTDIIDELKKKAQALFDQAQKFTDPKDAAEAQLVAQALDTWPNLPGLAAYSNQVRNKYPILRVGVREFPKYMSPALACTDSERRVVEFLFEGLVKFSPDATGMGRFHPGLAAGRPDVVALGRQFLLPDNALWYDEEAIKVADIVETMVQLKKGRGNGLPAACGELYAETQAVVPSGQHRFSIKLSKGYLEPLSLMTFKILPRASALPKNLQDEMAFAENPVGSGPFKFVPGRHTESGREYLSFMANLHYGTRADKLGLPRFREVRLFKYANALDEVPASKHFLDLLLDLTPEEAAKVKEDGASDGFRVTLPEPNVTLPNLRVYFLAINHRRADLQQQDVRRALAKAINREQLLDKHLRGALGKQIDKALNGPYPAGSWANNPGVTGGANKGSPDPFDPDTAKALYAGVTADQRYKPPALSLKFPSNDAMLESAMKVLKTQIEQTLPGVRINLEAVTPWALRDAVETTHDFDLAYYAYDFPDDTYSLWPLFGGEENYFGYRNDKMVTPPLRKSIRFCDFAKVQEQARELHLAFDLDVPLIPLWQLDPLIAVHKSVKTVPFDRHLIFTDIEQWRLEGNPRD